MYISLIYFVLNSSGYIFTSPRSLKKGQNNQLQLIRFGCFDKSALNVQLYYKKNYNSNETLAHQQTYNIPKGKTLNF